jgi:hypothetical protein
MGAAFLSGFPFDRSGGSSGEAVFLLVFFDGAPLARGDVAVSPASTSAAASAAAFLSAASRCLAKPSRSGAVNLKNSNTRFVQDPFSSATVSLYSFGDTGPRIKSP